jgi:DNA repair exonuclease SbcCD ATPase subunit
MKPYHNITTPATMNVQLSNFRCHRKQTFTFSPGLNLIEGKSGMGKTTILDAISWCLLGKIRNVVTRGEKKCSVTLHLDGLQITRTKLPGRLLILFPDGRQLEDDAAQHHIYSLIGGEHFELTSYMLQKGTEQFFTLPKEEKRRFVESLSKQHNNLESTKERIQNRLKDLKSALLSHQTRLSLLEKDAVKKPSDVDLIGMQTRCDQIGTQTLLQNVKLFYSNQLLDLKKVLQHHYDRLSSLRSRQSQRADLQMSLSLLQSQSQELHARLQLIDYSSLSGVSQKVEAGKYAVDYQKKKAELLTAKRNYEDLIKQEELSLQSQIKDLESQLESVEPVDEIDVKTAEKNYANMKRFKELQSKLPVEVDLDSQSVLVKELKDRVTQAQQRKTVLGCPHCNKGLVIKGSGIDKSDSGPLSIEEKKKLTEAVERLPTEEKKLQTFNRQKIVREQLLQEMKDIVVVESAEEDYSVLRKKWEIMKKVEQKNQIVTIQLSALKKSTAKDKYSVLRKQYEKELEVFKAMPKGESVDNLEELVLKVDDLKKKKMTAETLRVEKDSVDNKIIEKRELLSTLPEEESVDPDVASEMASAVGLVEERLRGLAGLESRVKEIGEYAQKRIEYKKWESRVTRVRELIEITQREITSLETFLRKVGEAETKCLEETIQLLNSKTAAYLNKFFPEEAVRVELATEKENKKGSVKTEIAVRVVYRGEECDLTSLSGGEYDRCALAFLMTVNEICGSNVLILDESIGSLDMTNAENVLDVLKECSNGEKVVILVQHQATCGAYDHVVRV